MLNNNDFKMDEIFAVRAQSASLMQQRPDGIYDCLTSASFGVHKPG